MPNPWDKPQAAGKGNPWDPPQPGGAASAAAVPAPETNPQPPAPKKGMLDRLAEWGEKKFPHLAPGDMQKEEDSGFGFGVPAVDRFLANTATTTLKGLTGLPAAAVDAVTKAAWTPRQSAEQMQARAEAGTPVDRTKPLPNIDMEHLSDLGSQMLGQATAGAIVGEGVGSALRIPGKIKNVVRGPVDDVMPGTTITPRQRYEGAKRVGVDLPVTQATNSKVLKPLDWINEGGVASGPVRDAANAKNVTALTKSTNAALEGMSPLDAESGGRVIQGDMRKPFVDLQNRANDTLHELSPMGDEEGGLRVRNLAQEKMDQLHADSTAGYDAFHDAYSDQPVADVGTVTEAAANIAGKNERFARQFPSLVSRKVESIVGDARKLGSNPALGAAKVGDLIRSRSALLDMTRDPEIIKSSYMADLQNLIGAHDRAIMDSLPAEGQNAWRELNEKYADIKNTFDNPSNPYYHALRTDNPSKLATGVGGQTPEAVRQLEKITGPEGKGIVRRGTADKLFGRTGTSEYDLGNFGTRLERTPESFRNELFTGDQHQDLRDIGETARELKPLEKFANTDDPQSLVSGIGPKTAQGLRNVRDIPVKPEGAVGPINHRIRPEGMGAMQRGVATDLLGHTGETGFNLKRFPLELEKLDPGYRNELFGPETHGTLQDIGHTARALDVDYNRSSSGKTAQKVAEIGQMFSGSPLPLLQRPLAQFLTSPKVADWMMKPSKLPSQAVKPVVAVGAYEADKRKKSASARH